MQPSQTSSLLAELAAVDNREVTPLTVEAWHSVIGHLEYHVARRALVKARQNQAIQYVEPKHILASVAAVHADDDRERRRVIEPAPVAAFPSRPANFDAMAAAWKDKAAFAREVAVYNRQLAGEGFPPVVLR